MKNKTVQILIWLVLMLCASKFYISDTNAQTLFDNTISPNASCGKPSYLTTPLSSFGKNIHSHDHQKENITDWQNGYTLILTNNKSPEEMKSASNFVTGKGGRIAILLPHVMLGWVSPEIAPQLVGNYGIELISYEPVELARLKYQNDTVLEACSFFNEVSSGRMKQSLAEKPIDATPLSGDAFPHPSIDYEAYKSNLENSRTAPSLGNSDSLTGTVAVALFFVESNGGIDPNSYTWNSTNQQNTYNRALSGLSWWSSTAPSYGRSVSFTPVVYSSTSPVTQQPYEPILHQGVTENQLWVNPIMANLGYTSGNNFARVTAFNTWLRGNQQTDWAVSVFIGYNPSPAPDRFTDNYFAFTWKGGPYIQMLFRNNGWGEAEFGRVLTHEIGHDFWACDEYYEAGYGGCTSCGACASEGPRPTILNGNCEFCNTSSIACMMKSNSYALCQFTVAQIGWSGSSGCSYSLSATSSPTFAAAGGNGSFGVITSSSCAWTAVSNASWISVTAGSSGSGNGTVSYSVQTNTGAARTGTITAAGQTFTVSQVAGSSGCPATSIALGQTISGSLTTSDCVFTGTTRYVDIYSFSGTAGQRIAVSMSSAAFDTYLFLINPSNQTIAEDDDGGGSTNSRIPATSGYITLPVTGNFTIYATSYTTTGVGGTGSYTISLAGEVNCSYSLSPTGQSVSASGGNSSVSVTAPAGCSWTAASNASWISITSGSSGSGSGTVNYSVQANTGAARTGTMTIGGQTFTVSQAAGSTSCPPASFISVGQTVSGTLQSGDCLYTDGSYYDAYTFNGTAGQQIYVTMNSSQFDAYLLLYQGNYPGGSLIAQDNNGNGGTNARIPITSGYLTLPSNGTYTILANSLSSGMIGSYSLFLGTNTAPPATRKAFDFDGDGKADVAVFRPSNGAWYLQQSQAGFTGLAFGLSTDKIVPADYDGDGKTDIAVYRAGTWYIQRSSLGFIGLTFGDGNDIPMPADYDGDGKADVAVFRPSNGGWYMQRSNLGFTGMLFGQNGDKPVAADYDGDGKADVAVNRNGTWYLQRSQLGFTGIAFGDSNDRSVPADYDGDGKADIAVFRPSNGYWYLLQSTNGFTGIGFGIGTDVPVPADYDGDGKADISVFRGGNWYLNRTQQGFTGMLFGVSSDLPIQSAFVR